MDMTFLDLDWWIFQSKILFISAILKQIFAICLLASMVLFLAVRKKQHCDTRGEGKQ